MNYKDTVLSLLQRISTILENKLVLTEPKPRVINDRFTDNGDGTILDKDQKVIWIKDPSQVPGFEKPMTFNEAKEACENLVYGGYNSRWRVPTIKELFSIIDYTRKDPMWDTNVFNGKYSNNYWSATEDSATYAYFVYFYNGDVYNGPKSYTYYVRAVRSGQ